MLKSSVLAKQGGYPNRTHSSVGKADVKKLGNALQLVYGSKEKEMVHLNFEDDFT